MTGQARRSVAGELRRDIFEARLQPGDRLDEVSLGQRLEVSRNTLREAFRLLEAEGLVDHEPNRGVFVHRVDGAEARQVYTARRLVECGALREAAVLRASNAIPDDVWRTRVAALRAAVTAGAQAAAVGDWEAAGSANSRFHLAVVALAGNDILDRFAERLLTTMRLAFVVAATARTVHERYVGSNDEVATYVELGDLARAALSLEDYLLRAEGHLVEGL